MVDYFSTAVGAIRYLPDVIQVGRDLWNRLKPPDQLPTGTSGVSNNTYYSSNYKFSISIPDDQWRFWEPTPQYIASLGLLLAMPTRALPITILSKQMIHLFRPNVQVIVEDVGSFANIKDVVDFSVESLRASGLNINNDDIHISTDTQSGVLITSQPYLGNTTLYNVQSIYLHAKLAYTISISYVPLSENSKALFGGLQDILSSFKLIT